MKQPASRTVFVLTEEILPRPRYSHTVNKDTTRRLSQTGSGRSLESQNKRGSQELIKDSAHVRLGSRCKSEVNSSSQQCFQQGELFDLKLSDISCILLDIEMFLYNQFQLILVKYCLYLELVVFVELHVFTCGVASLITSVMDSRQTADAYASANGAWGRGVAANSRLMFYKQIWDCSYTQCKV